MADRNGTSARRRASRRTGTSADSIADQTRVSVGPGIDPTRIGVVHPPGPTGISIVRHTDLVVLTVDWKGLQVDAAEDGVARLVKDGDDPAYLVLDFPPQHILEQAFFEVAADYDPPKLPDVHPDYKNDPDYTAPVDPDAPQEGEPSKGDDPLEPPPIDHLISGPSRLVFVVSDEALPLELTLSGILEACAALPLSVPDNALPPPAAPVGKQFELVSKAWPDLVEVLVDQPLARQPISAEMVARARRAARTLEARLGVGIATGSVTRVRRADDLARRVLGPGPVFRAPPAKGPTPQEPTPLQTAIETPYRVIVSPHAAGSWAHSANPVTSAETAKTELWHTRLGVRADGVTVEGSHPGLIRAVWARAEGIATPAFGKKVETGDRFPNIGEPWRRSLDSFDRHNVVHLSSNFNLQAAGGGTFVPQPIDVDLLMLSSLGAWMDTRGAWEVPQPKGLSVEEWRQRSTLGRDHYVRIVYAGWLFPFGHRASLVKITERKFHPDEPGNVAYLRQRMFLVVREPLKKFRISGEKDLLGNSYDREMPFEWVRITTRVSPDLDPPKDSPLLKDEEYANAGLFWPHVGGAPFRFHVVLTDVEGNDAQVTMPLVFVGKEHTDEEWHDQIVADIAAAYNADPRATVPFHGQTVAYAESEAPDDTAFETAALTFGGRVATEVRYDHLDWWRPRFWPVAQHADVLVPALKQIAGSASPVTVEYPKATGGSDTEGNDRAYLRAGFGGGNPGHVFLAATGGANEVRFSGQGDRSGGLIKPDLDLSGVSRRTGPVSGDLAKVAANEFDPSTFFAGLEAAKLFGTFSLTTLIEPVTGIGASDLDKVPRFVGQNANVVERLLADLRQILLDLAEAGNVDGFKEAAADFISSPGDVNDLKDATSALPGQLGGVADGLRRVIERRAASISAAVQVLSDTPSLLGRFLDGDILPAAPTARFEWRPRLRKIDMLKLKGDSNGRNLVISAEAVAKADGSGEPEVTVTGSLDDFSLHLLEGIFDMVEIEFKRVQFRSVAGKKPEIDVEFLDVEFLGPLAFVKKLQDMIPFDGFSDPPSVDVSADGITAGYTQALPNLSVGVLSLENLSLGAGFDIPFTDQPLSVWFRFCERENPALLTVYMFGGGGFFGLALNADGIHVLEASFEFGASISVDFGVASGGVSAMAGIYFRIDSEKASLTAYFRLRGHVRALAIVSVSIELYLDMAYEFAPSNKLTGTATISVEISVAILSKTIHITATRKFAGSGGDPTFAEIMDVDQAGISSPAWEEYCGAFA